VNILKMNKNLTPNKDPNNKLHRKYNKSHLLYKFKGITLITLILSSTIFSSTSSLISKNPSNSKISVHENDSTCPRASLSENPIWFKTWGTTSRDYAHSIWGDGTYLYTIGNTESNWTVKFDVIIIKWDSEGNIIWNRTWGGRGYDYGISIWGDGTYLYTTGYTDSYGAGKNDLHLIKWDINGNQIWNKTWGGFLDDYGYSIWGDGNYVYTTGSAENSGDRDLLLIKWDVQGNLIWYKTWGSESSDQGNSIWGDGTYLYTTGNTDGGLVINKWDTEGNLIWYETFGSQYDEEGNSIWGDGTYLYTTGYTYSFGAGSEDLLLIKWDLDGNSIWIKSWGESSNDRGNSIWGDGTYLYTTGETLNSEADNYKLVLIKWDTAGNPVWNIVWGGLNWDSSYSVWGDGTYLYTTGYTSSFGAGNYDIVTSRWALNLTSSTFGTFDEYIPINYENIIYYTIGILIICGFLIVIFKKKKAQKSKMKLTRSTQNSVRPIQNLNARKSNFKSSQQSPHPTRAVSQKKKIDDMKQQLKLQQIQKEKELLTKFRRIINMASEIKQSQAAEILGITEKELIMKLFEWSELMPFKIKGEMIVVDDISAFTSALDKQFTEWKTKEHTKEGKIENIKNIDDLDFGS
jgi:hypothetical protein